MMEQALLEFAKEHEATIEKITKIPLEGEGTIETRVERCVTCSVSSCLPVRCGASSYSTPRLYSNLKMNESWMNDLHEADVVIVATHSQGSVVSTHLLDRLIRDNHIVTSRNQSLANSVVQAVGTAADVFPSSIGLNGSTTQTGTRRKVQRVCCLALCGIHHGPLRYLNSSTLVGPYIQVCIFSLTRWSALQPFYWQYFESAAARELFEFQVSNRMSVLILIYSLTRSEYGERSFASLYGCITKCLGSWGRCFVVGQVYPRTDRPQTKMVYIASLNDQVVPLYSGLFTAVTHPLILRALYIDGDAYQ